MDPGQINLYGKRYGNFICDGYNEADGLRLLLTLSNTPPSSSSSSYGRFTRASLNPCGTKLITGDNLGDVYYFNIERNSFALLCQLKSCCTAIKVSDDARSDILLGTSTGSFHCFHSEDCSQAAEFLDHASSIFYISTNADNTLVLVCSEELGALYSLTSFVKLRCLTNIKGISLSKAFFVPVSNNIISSYRDGSIFVWDSDTLECINELTSPKDGYINIRSLDASLDGRYIAAGGSGRVLKIWDLEGPSSPFMTPFEMSIKQVTFIPCNDSSEKHLLAILGCNGSFFVYDVEEKSTVYLVEAKQDMLMTVSIAVKSRTLCAVTSGGYVKYFDMRPLYDILCGKAAVLKDDTLHSHRPPSTSVYVADIPVRQLRRKMDDYIQMMKPFKQFDDLALQQLQEVLRNYGEYPRKYRYLIWEKVLQLPENTDAFFLLLRRAVSDQELSNIFPPFPILDETVATAFKKMLGCLLHWSPQLQSVDFLPLFAYPFVKLLHSNLRMCFEILATLISNYWQLKWFIPTHCHHFVTIVDDMLRNYEPTLVEYFERNSVSSEVYGLSLLKSAFSEVFVKDDWLKVWDNILTNAPMYLICLVVAFNIVSKESLLSLSSSDIVEFFGKQNNIPASQVIQEAFRLMDAESKRSDLQNLNELFTPLSKHIYQCLSKDMTAQVNGVEHFNTNHNVQIRSREILSSQVMDIISSGPLQFHNEACQEPIEVIWKVLNLRNTLAKKKL